MIKTKIFLSSFLAMLLIQTVYGSDYDGYDDGEETAYTSSSAASFYDIVKATIDKKSSLIISKSIERTRMFSFVMQPVEIKPDEKSGQIGFSNLSIKIKINPAKYVDHTIFDGGLRLVDCPNGEDIRNHIVNDVLQHDLATNLTEKKRLARQITYDQKAIQLGQKGNAIPPDLIQKHIKAQQDYVELNIRHNVQVLNFFKQLKDKKNYSFFYEVPKSVNATKDAEQEKKRCGSLSVTLTADPCGSAHPKALNRLADTTTFAEVMEQVFADFEDALTTQFPALGEDISFHKAKPFGMYQ